MIFGVRLWRARRPRGMAAVEWLWSERGTSNIKRILRSDLLHTTYAMLTGFDKDGGWGQIYLSCPKNKCVPL